MENEINTNGENKITVIDETLIKQFQSLYYLIKGKRDTDIKLFTEYKQFCFDDILELNSKVYRKLELHQLVTDIVSVTVGLDNKEIKSFGSWQEFKNTDWNISSRTKYISIEWDFNLLLPNQGHNIPQTHTLRVRIGNSLKPSEMIQVVFQGGDEYELDEVQAQMSCKIDFVNSQISNELKSVVSEWYDALPNNSDDHKLIKFILRHEVKLQNFIVLSFLTSGIILVNYLFYSLSSTKYRFLPSDKYHFLFVALTLSVAFLYLFFQLGELYADRMMSKQIGKLKRNPMFEFTKGDKNLFNEIEKLNKVYLKGILKSILLGLSVNGISFLLGYLFHILIE